MNDAILSYKDSTGKIVALVIKAEHSNQGINFLTKDDDFMQVAYMGHPAGHDIVPHYHNKIPRTVDYTCETLIMRKGKMEVNLYEAQKLIHTFILSAGDVLTMFGGGHGFKMIDDVEMIEIKQGPYMGVNDKTRF
jgi:hypothetical protein